nr:MAG: ORF1 [TTV-like mini virus]
MPPYRRNWNRFYRQKRRWRKNKYGFWRPRRRLRRYRRTTWVRKRQYRKRFKKLKFIKLKQWQPMKIRKCKIRGIIELFECTYGHVSNNFVPYKESYVPEHQPGGGGWGIQQFTLGNLYVQNVYCMNYWTKSNKGMNLCRYFGTKFTLYRQDNVDWIFTYNLEEPLTIGKYTYPSYHPYKMLQYKKKIVIPSFTTAPLKRKRYYKKFIRPPKKLTNQWYFQNHLQNTPLVTFFACACDLTKMFLPKYSKNNNITLWALNTRLIENPKFQLTNIQTTGYTPDTAGKKTLWGLYHAQEPPSETQATQLIYLGRTQYNTEGEPINNTAETNYNKDKWGNPFHVNFITNTNPTYLLEVPTTQSDKNAIKYIFSQKNQQIKNIQGLAQRFEDLAIPVRYNPNKDKGIGNRAYFLRTDKRDQNNWDPPDDEEYTLKNFPLWLMLWGYEDYIRKYNPINNLDTNGILVIQSDYFNEKLPAYVLISDDFVNGLAPYGESKEEMNVFERGHWYPRWEHQKRAIENLLMTGPAVARPAEGESIQAHLQYQFFFKWGGNPSTLETIYDPNIQPVTPDPSFGLQNHEIISPTTSIENFIYNWDTRRDLLTQAATDRITKIPTNFQYVFTDGTTTSTDLQIPQQKETQATTTQEEKEEDQLLHHLIQLQQHNQQLQQRFRQLKQIMDTS